MEDSLRRDDFKPAPKPAPRKLKSVIRYELCQAPGVPVRGRKLYTRVQADKVIRRARRLFKLDLYRVSLQVKL